MNPDTTDSAIGSKYDDEGSLSSVPNSAKKMASNLKARFQAEQSEEKRWKKLDPIQFEKQKVFNLMMDTSMNSQSQIRSS